MEVITANIRCRYQRMPLPKMGKPAMNTQYFEEKFKTNISESSFIHRVF